MLPRWTELTWVRRFGACRRLLFCLCVPALVGAGPARCGPWAELPGDPCAAMAEQASQDLVTNDTVIRLVKAGLSEDLILSVIGRSRTSFTLDAKAIVELRQAGVSNRIIQEMLRLAPPAVGPAEVVPAPAAAAPSPPTATPLATALQTRAEPPRVKTNALKHSLMGLSLLTGGSLLAARSKISHDRVTAINVRLITTYDGLGRVVKREQIDTPITGRVKFSSAPRLASGLTLAGAGLGYSMLGFLDWRASRHRTQLASQPAQRGRSATLRWTLRLAGLTMMAAGSYLEGKSDVVRQRQVGVHRVCNYTYPGPVESCPVNDPVMGPVGVRSRPHVVGGHALTGLGLAFTLASFGGR